MGNSGNYLDNIIETMGKEKREKGKKRKRQRRKRRRRGNVVK